MEDQRLSSVGTIAYKYLVTAVYLSPLVVWAFAEYVYGNPKSCWVAVPVFALIAVYCFVFYFPLKRVSALPEGLRISNYISTITVPYSQILEVRECKWVNIRPITIRLKQPCKFGRAIRFMPRGQFLILLWRDHPVATFLREKIRHGSSDPHAP